jgi:hypothetical protein
VADPAIDQVRREIASQLQQHERDLSMGNGAVVEPPQPLDPRSMRPKEPGDPGPPPPGALRAPPDDGTAAKFTPGQGGWVTNGGDVQGLKDTARGALAVASGGLTERTADKVAGAPEQAASEVQGKTLETMTPEGMVELMMRAGVVPAGQKQAAYALIKPHWQPGTRTDAQGSTGKDPNAVRAAFELQGDSEQAQAKALNQTQAADRTQYDMLGKAQQNEMSAIKSFKSEHDALQSRYEGERQAQMDRMVGIQKAMDAVPDAPRTIRQKMDRSGFSDKAALGLAAAFSVLGGATLRDGGKSVQTFLGNVQANIDRDVKKEADEFARLGERAKMSDNIYAHLRQGVQDDTQAMNLTKALYYDAAANTVQQIATQYKMDTQSPQIQSLLAHLAEERKRLVLDTAQTMQSQFSQTDKFNPGGVVQVGGGAKKDPNEYKSTDLDKDSQKYSEELEKRGFNMGERAIGLYQGAIEAMRKGGFDKDEKFWRTFAAMNSASGDNAAIKQAAILASLPEDKRKAMQLIVEAGRERLKDSSGKSVTANELAREIMTQGGFSIDSLDQVRQTLAANREQIQNSAAGGFDPRVVDRYHARKDLQGVGRRYAGIGTGARQAIDVKDIATQVEGRLSK